MADTECKQPASPPISPLKPADGGESPTTARPLDFDSDHETEPKTPTKSDTVAPKPPPKDEEAAPPPKPPRPLSPREQAEATLREAFPSIDASVVKAVLTASGGQIEPAFNALLGMSDPDSQRELETAAPAPPPRPPRPRQQQRFAGQQATAQPQSQLDADELYARQLQEHYAHTDQGHRSGGPDRFNSNLPPSRPGRPGAHPNPDDVPWRSFIDDDLPEIRDNIKKGFMETQSTINKWITNFKKRIDGEDGDDDVDFDSHPAQPAQGYGNRHSSDSARRSADLQRYDADPQLIDDDFSKLELRDADSTPAARSNRPLAGIGRFQPPSAMARKSPSPSHNGRKVSFQAGPPDEINDLYSASSPKPTVSSATKSSKWQPLAVADPSPIDNDPFSLGDSDDEKDAKPISLKDNEDSVSDTDKKKYASEATAETATTTGANAATAATATDTEEAEAVAAKK